VNSSKFYRRSLTLLLPILKLISEGFSLTEVSETLNIKKPHVTYYVKRAKEHGLLKEVTRDRFKILEITQAGRNFLAMYQHISNMSARICRAENIRFKAPVYKMPSTPVDWHKVEMHNWNQYTTEVDSIKIKLNDGLNPTIELIPDSVDGDDPFQLYCSLTLACNDVARNLEQTLGMRIGRLELSSKGEWVIYSPLARTITKYTGRVTVEGIGRINASLPGRIGEFEFFDPRAAAEFLEMPRRMARIEQNMKKLLQYHKGYEPN
jgi:predicted transcriptional regulator